MSGAHTSYFNQVPINTGRAVGPNISLFRLRAGGRVWDALTLPIQEEISLQVRSLTSLPTPTGDTLHCSKHDSTLLSVYLLPSYYGLHQRVAYYTTAVQYLLPKKSKAITSCSVLLCNNLYCPSLTQLPTQ